MDWQTLDIEAAKMASRAHDVPLQWVLGVVGAESSYREPVATWEPNAKEYSWGPMQILGSTARGEGFTGPLADLLTPEVGIYYGTSYMRRLIDRFGLNYPWVISAYNRGPGLADPVAGADYVARVTRWLPEVQEEIGAAVSAAEDSAGLLVAAAAVAALYFAARKGRR